MSFPRILAIAGRIVSQFRRDHRTLALVIVAPIIIMSIFGYIMRSQESDTINVAVVNEDSVASGQTSLAAPVIDNLKKNAKLSVAEMDRSAATEAVRDGSRRVALVFGPDFSSRLRTERKSSVEVIVEGSNPGQAGPALATIGQSLMETAPVVLKSVVPAPMNAALPTSLPLEIKTTRLYGSADIKALDFFAPIFIAYIGFFLIFLLTSVSFLRERTQGTMERLAASPVTRLEMVLGYMLGFGLFSVLQAVILLLFTIYVLGVKLSGNPLSLFAVTLALVLGAVNLGIFLSTFARNELQAIQFIPIVIVPQVLLAGLLWPVQEMPTWLQWIARAMPLTYAVDAMTDIMIRGRSLFENWLPLLVLLAFAAAFAFLAAGTVKREVA